MGGKPLLQWLIDACIEAGLTRIVVVTGYRANDIDAWLAEAQQRVGSNCQLSTVFNAEHATINNAHSVWVARDALAGESFIKLDGDILLPDAQLLGRLVAHPHRTTALVDHERALDEEAMKVRVDGSLDDNSGRVTAFGKWLSLTEASGESIGIEKIDALDAPAFFAAIEAVVHRDGNHDAYYEDVYHHLLQQPESNWAMAACSLAGLPWTEIDDHADLAAARKLVG